MKKSILAFAALALAAVSVQAQTVRVFNKDGSTTNFSVNAIDSVVYLRNNIMTDSRDGQVYKTVTIGGKTWMAENLNYGTMIPGTAGALQSGAQKFCYKDQESNCETQGALYQWHTAVALPEVCGGTSKVRCIDSLNVGNHQGICPTGWHIPSSSEFGDLLNAVRGKSPATEAGALLKATATGYTNWDNAAFNGGDAFAFSVLPVGKRAHWGTYLNVGIDATYWTKGENNDKTAWVRYFNASSKEVARNYNMKQSGFSVRCVQD
jgi:uncharacterized protein (TIGR02145 family)